MVITARRTGCSLIVQPAYPELVRDDVTAASAGEVSPGWPSRHMRISAPSSQLLSNLFLTVTERLAPATLSYPRGPELPHRKKPEKPRFKARLCVLLPIDSVDHTDCRIVYEGVVSGSDIRYVVSESGTLVSAKAFGSGMAARWLHCIGPRSTLVYAIKRGLERDN